MSEVPNFNILEGLQTEHSKAMTNKIVNYIGADVERMAQLMACFFGKDVRVSQRAAMSVCWVADKYPKLIEPYLEKMLILSRQSNVHNALQRNTMRILREMPEIPASVIGLTADTAFSFLETPSTPVAIRAFSMRVLYKISQKEPDLKNELKLIIETFLPHETLPAFTSTAKDVLKKLMSEL